MNSYLQVVSPDSVQEFEDAPHELDEWLTEQKYITPVNYDTLDNDKKAQLNALLCTYSLQQYAKSVLNPAEYYQILIPLNIRRKLASGESWILNDKNGGLLPIIMHKVDGKTQIETNLRMIKTLADSSAAAANLMITMMLSSISEGIAEVKEDIARLGKKVSEITQREFARDIGKLQGNLNQLGDVLKNNQIDFDEKKAQLFPLISNMRENLGALTNILRTIQNEFIMIPQEWQKIWKLCKDKDFINNQDEHYNQFFYYFIACKRGYQALSICYSLCEYESLAKQVWEEFQDLVSSFDIDRIASIKNLHNNYDFSNEWFSRPEEYLNNATEEILAITESANTVCIEIKGEKLEELTA